MNYQETQTTQNNVFNVAKDTVNLQPEELRAMNNEEFDTSCVVRPEQFYSPEAWGLLIPICKGINKGKAQYTWKHYIQKADGERLCLDFRDYLELQPDRNIWFSPNPGVPAMEQTNWTLMSRSAWLKGYSPQIAEIFRRLCEQFEYFLEFPEADREGMTATLALWTMNTYVSQVWDVVPYVSIGGPAGSGKTRVFELLKELIWRPLSASNMTAPSLFRTLHAQGGCLLLDEAETLRSNSPEVERLLSILNSGYKKGSPAVRLVGEGYETGKFDAFGPKALAAINGLPPALLSRCIRMHMFRAPANSPKPRRRLQVRKDIFSALRDDLHCMALSYGMQVQQLAGNLPVNTELNGRDYEIWSPLFTLAYLIEQDGMHGLVDIVNDFAQQLAGEQQEHLISEVDEKVLQTLAEQIMAERYGITAQELLEFLKQQYHDLFRSYTTAKSISTILNRYGLKSKPSNGKRYFRPSIAQLRQIQESYGIELGISQHSDQNESDGPFSLPQDSQNENDGPSSLSDFSDLRNVA